MPIKIDNKRKNICPRCGKERIVTKIWKEKVGMSEVTTVEKSCPDSDCQRVVTNEINLQIRKRVVAEEKRKKRMIDNRRNRKKVKN